MPLQGGGVVAGLYWIIAISLAAGMKPRTPSLRIRLPLRIRLIRVSIGGIAYQRL
mgnify:CR=1 FL=1